MKPDELTPTGTEAATPRASRTTGGRFARDAAARSVRLTVATRRQTPQERRQFDAAFNLLLAEWGRRELSPSPREE
jgi:hypothetical protein